MGLPAIVGDEAIRRFYEEQWFTLPYVEISGQVETIVVAASGDLAYLDGRSNLTLEISGENISSEGKYLGVWQKVQGQWRLAAISWTANEPARYSRTRESYANEASALPAFPTLGRKSLPAASSGH